MGRRHPQGMRRHEVRRDCHQELRPALRCGPEQHARDRELERGRRQTSRPTGGLGLGLEGLAPQPPGGLGSRRMHSCIHVTIHACAHGSSASPRPPASSLSHVLRSGGSHGEALSRKRKTRTLCSCSSTRTATSSSQCRSWQASKAPRGGGDGAEPGRRPARGSCCCWPH